MKKQRKPKSKQNLKQIAHRIVPDSHKSTGNKIIRTDLLCISKKKDQGEVQLLPNSIFPPQLGKQF